MFSPYPARSRPDLYSHLPVLPGVPQWRLDFGPKAPEKVASWAQALLRDGVLTHDNETTGLSDDKETVEVGLIDAQGEILFEERVRPTIAVDPGAAAVHGISQDVLNGAPGFNDVGPEFFRQLEAHATEGRVFVAAYNLPFDPETLANSARAAGVEIPSTPEVIWVDVMSAHQTLRQGRRPSKLTVAAAEGGVEVPPNAHSAVADCRMTLGVLTAIAEERYGRSADLKNGLGHDELRISVQTRPPNVALGARGLLHVDGPARRPLGLQAQYTFRGDTAEQRDAHFKDALGPRLAERLLRGFPVRIPAKEVADRIRGLDQRQTKDALISRIAQGLEHLPKALQHFEGKRDELLAAKAAGCSPEEAVAKANMTVARDRNFTEVTIDSYSLERFPTRDGADVLQEALRCLNLAQIKAIDSIQSQLDVLRSEAIAARVPDPVEPDLGYLAVDSRQLAKVVEGPQHLVGMLDAAIKRHGLNAHATDVFRLDELALTPGAGNPGWLDVELGHPQPDIQDKDFTLCKGSLQCGPNGEGITLGTLRDLAQKEVGSRISEEWAGLPTPSQYRRIEGALADLFPQEALPEVLDTIRDTAADYLRRLAKEIERF